MLVDIGDTRLFCEVLGDGHPLIVLHGGPGLDHGYFRPWLDPLAERVRLIFVDQRGHGRSDPVADAGALTVEGLAADVSSLANALGLERYAVMGHSFGTFVTLQHAVDFPAAASHHLIVAGVPSLRYMEAVERNLEAFEPVELREQVAASWARETEIETVEELRQLVRDQMPFHFLRLEEPYRRLLAGSEGLIGAPAILRAFARRGYGPFDVEDRLGRVSSPTLVLAGRHDRACVIEAAEAIHRGVPGSELLVFEESAHMLFAEEPDKFQRAIVDFFERHP